VIAQVKDERHLAIGVPSAIPVSNVHVAGDAPEGALHCGSGSSDGRTADELSAGLEDLFNAVGSPRQRAPQPLQV